MCVNRERLIVLNTTLIELGLGHMLLIAIVDKLFISSGITTSM